MVYLDLAHNAVMHVTSRQLQPSSDCCLTMWRLRKLSVMPPGWEKVPTDVQLALVFTCTYSLMHQSVNENDRDT